MKNDAKSGNSRSAKDDWYVYDVTCVSIYLTYISSLSFSSGLFEACCYLLSLNYLLCQRDLTRTHLSHSLDSSVHEVVETTITVRNFLYIRVQRTLAIGHGGNVRKCAIQWSEDTTLAHLQTFTNGEAVETFPQLLFLATEQFALLHGQ